MRSIKHALAIGSILGYAILLTIDMSGCNGQMNVSAPPTTQNTTKSAATSSVAVAINDAPYNYAGTQTANNGCWENQVRTNGPSFGASGNSGYFCYGGGASYSASPYAAYPNDITWIGFYRDGTISLRDQAGVDHTYTAWLPYGGLNCELDLKDASNNVQAIIGPVNYPGYPTNVLDSQDHMQYMEVQTMVNGRFDSGSLWTCEYAGQFGVQ